MLVTLLDPMAELLDVADVSLYKSSLLPAPQYLMISVSVISSSKSVKSMIRE